MYEVDFEAAWASALALQANDEQLQVGDVVRHASDARIYLLRQIINSLAHCTLAPGEGDPEYAQDFPLNELVKPQHINLAEMLHSNRKIIAGDISSPSEVSSMLIELLRSRDNS